MSLLLAFEYLDDEEKQFRVEQMIGAMYTLFVKYKLNEKLLVLEDVFETVLDHGTFSMIQELYQYLSFCKIQGNAALDNIFFNAIRKHNELIDLKSIPRRLSSSSKNVFEWVKEEDDEFDEVHHNRTMTDYIHNSIPSTPDRQTFSILPVVNRNIGYDDREQRIRRYLDSLNPKSKYYKKWIVREF